MDKLKNLTFGKALMIGIGIAAVYYFSLYDDGAVLENQITQATTEVKAKTAEIESIRKAIEDAERYQQTMLVLGAEMERVLKAIPAKLTSLELMKIISTEAKQVGSEINSLTSPQTFRGVDPSAPKAFFEPVPIEVTLTGSYNQVMSFLSNLTKLDKIITAKGLLLTVKTSQFGNSSSTSNPTIAVEMKASFQAYRYASADADPAKAGATGAGGK